MAEPKEGDLQVLYIPQVPMKPFTVDIERHEGQSDSSYLQRAAETLNVIINFSIFEFENRIKPDYSDMAAIARWEDGDWEELDEEEYEKWMED